MPEIFRKDKFLQKNRHLNQKLHMDMTEEEKAKVARCRGRKSGHPCKDPIFRCLECGNYGCTQDIIDKCPEQGFKNGKCLQCGAVDSNIPVMLNELDQVITEWEKK